MFTEPEAPSAARDELPVTSQLILGADKRNPVFTVYRDRERERLLLGFEILDVVGVPTTAKDLVALFHLDSHGFESTSRTETL